MSNLRATATRTALAALAAMAFALAAAGDARAGSCIDWQKLMSRYEVSLLPEGKSVLVMPFTNFTKQAGDDWMILGLRDYVADLLEASRNLRVISGLTALYAGDASSPAWKVAGRLQRSGPNLRVFISLTEGMTDKLLKQIEVTFPYPDNREFFTRLADATKELLRAMDAGLDDDAFARVRDATDSTAAYEAYSKGRQLLEAFTPQKAAESEAFFRDAKRLDYRSPLGYEGILAVNAFLGFYNKQIGQPFSSFYQKAEAELVLMARLAKPASGVFGSMSGKPQRKKEIVVKLDNRFLASNAAFMEALHASQAGNLEVAADALGRTVELVPEDAVAWRELAAVSSKLGDVTKSAEAMRKAREIDPCM